MPLKRSRKLLFSPQARSGGKSSAFGGMATFLVAIEAVAIRRPLQSAAQSLEPQSILEMAGWM